MPRKHKNLCIPISNKQNTNDGARRKDVHKSCRQQEGWRVQWKECENAPQKEIVATCVAFVGERTLNTDEREHDSNERIRGQKRRQAEVVQKREQVQDPWSPTVKQGSSFDVYKLLISNNDL